MALGLIVVAMSRISGQAGVGVRASDSYHIDGMGASFELRVTRFELRVSSLRPLKDHRSVKQKPTPRRCGLRSWIFGNHNSQGASLFGKPLD
jgi:hypothetical protein